MGTNTPTLSLRTRCSAHVIQQRIEMLDQIRSGIRVVLRQATTALGDADSDAVAALQALEQAMRAPIAEIERELEEMTRMD